MTATLSARLLLSLALVSGGATVARVALADPEPTSSKPAAPAPVAPVAPAPDAPAPRPGAEPAPPPKAPTDAEIAQVRALFDAGRNFVLQGQYPEAIRSFEQAYAIVPRPNLILSQATAHKNLFLVSGDESHKVRAIKLFQEWFRLRNSEKLQSRDAQDSKLVAEATKSLQDLGPLPEQSGPTEAVPVVAPKTILAIDSPSEGAMISVDGGPSGPPQLRAEVTPGPHLVRVTAKGYVTKEVTVRARANLINPEIVALVEMPATVELVGTDAGTVYVDGSLRGDVGHLSLPPGRHFVSIVSNGRESAGKSIDLARADRATLSFARRPTAQRYASLVLLGAGGLGIAGGLVCFGVAGERDARASTLQRERVAGSITGDQLLAYEGLKSDRDALRTAGIASTAVGAAIGALGLTLFISDRPRPVAPPEERRDTPDSHPTAAPVEVLFLPSVGPEATGLWVHADF